MKRKWLFATLVSGVLAVGAMGGTVLAQETTPEEGRTSVLGRVAEILGLGEDEVKDAFDQATAEIRDERLDEHVESGKLTEEQAAELRERMDAENEVGGLLRDGRGFRHHRFGRRGEDFKFRFQFDGEPGDLPGLQERLDALSDGDRHFTFRFDGEIDEIPELDPLFEEMRERLWDGHLRFFFGPGGGPEDEATDEPADEPADETATGSGVSA
jgi:hypothetical protein